MFILFSCTQIVSITWYYSKSLIHAVSAERQRLKVTDQTTTVEVCFDRVIFEKLRENNEEIRWQGVLYDIEKTSFTGNQVKVQLRKDEDETNWLHLYETISAAVKKMNTTFPQATTGFWKWLFKSYNFPGNYNHSNLECTLNPGHKTYNPHSLPVSPYLPGNLQPPEAVPFS